MSPSTRRALEQISALRADGALILEAFMAESLGSLIMIDLLRLRSLIVVKYAWLGHLVIVAAARARANMLAPQDELLTSVNLSLGALILLSALIREGSVLVILHLDMLLVMVRFVALQLIKGIPLTSVHDLMALASSLVRLFQQYAVFTRLPSSTEALEVTINLRVVVAVSRGANIQAIQTVFFLVVSLLLLLKLAPLLL